MTKKYTTEQAARFAKKGRMSVMTQPGMLVVFVDPNCGYNCHKEQVKRLGLVVGQTYTVETIDVGRSSTSLTLLEFPGEHFNSVHFCNVPRQKLPTTTEHINYYLPSK